MSDSPPPPPASLAVETTQVSDHVDVMYSLYYYVFKYYMNVLLIVIQVEAGLFSTTFKISRKTTIPADKTEHKVSYCNNINVAYSCYVGR